MGEILAALHEHGLEDNTIVYFLSDNGGHLEALDKDGQRIGGHNGRFKGLTKWLILVPGVCLKNGLVLWCKEYMLGLRDVGEEAFIDIFSYVF